MALPETLNRSLKASASIAVSELYAEGRASAWDDEEWPYAQISERLDARTCPLCRYLDGKILRVGSPEEKRYRQPSHVNCRRILVAVHRDEEGVEPDVDPDDPELKELVRKHGHYHLDPEKHAELRIPAEPAGRHVIVRRVRNLETGKVETRLDWAPWWEQVPRWKRELVLRARATADAGELKSIFEQLGLGELSTGEQLREAALLGLRDRAEGWVTTAYGGAFDEMEVPRWLKEVIGIPTVPRAGRVRNVFESRESAEKWARENIPGLEHVDYSDLDLEAATALNQVAREVAVTFGVPVKAIAPYGYFGESEERDSLMFAGLPGIGYNRRWMSTRKADLVRLYFSEQTHTASAAKSFQGLAAHEMAHIVQASGRTSLGAALGEERSNERVRKRVDEYRRKAGRDAIIAELGPRAWHGPSGMPELAWQETWAQAFSAYWVDPGSLSRTTRRMVEDILGLLFPELR